MNRVVGLLIGTGLLLLSGVIFYSIATACVGAVVFEQCTSDPRYIVVIGLFIIAGYAAILTGYDSIFWLKNSPGKRTSTFKRFMLCSVSTFIIALFMLFLRV